MAGVRVKVVNDLLLPSGTFRKFPDGAFPGLLKYKTFGCDNSIDDGPSRVERVGVGPWAIDDIHWNREPAVSPQLNANDVSPKKEAPTP